MSSDSNRNRAQSSNPVSGEREEPRTGGIAQMSSNSNRHRAQSSKPVCGKRAEQHMGE